MNEKKLKVSNLVILLLGIILTLGFSAYAGGGLGLLLSGFTLLRVLPYLALLFVSYRAVSHRVLFTVTLLGTLFVLSTYLYFDSLFIRPDAQGALIFLFLPIYQLLALLVGFGILIIVGYIQKRRQIFTSSRF